MPRYDHLPGFPSIFCQKTEEIYCRIKLCTFTFASLSLKCERQNRWSSRLDFIFCCCNILFTSAYNKNYNQSLYHLFPPSSTAADFIMNAFFIATSAMKYLTVYVSNVTTQQKCRFGCCLCRASKRCRNKHSIIDQPQLTDL